MKDLEFLKYNLIAHRGYHNKDLGIPENSLLAFERAIKEKYIIELDIHILKDNNVVVFHDNNLERMTGLNKNIKDTTYNEIKDLKLNNTNNYIPLLKEVLELVDGMVPIIIELKYDTKTGLLESELMKILMNYKGKFVVKSFNPFSVYWFKKNYPQIIRGQLASNYSKTDKPWFEKILLKNFFFNIFTKPDFISYAIDSFPNKKVEEFRNNSGIVLGWTARNQEQFDKAKKYCDNIICENFDKLKI